VLRVEFELSDQLAAIAAAADLASVVLLAAVVAELELDQEHGTAERRCASHARAGCHLLRRFTL